MNKNIFFLVLFFACGFMRAYIGSVKDCSPKNTILVFDIDQVINDISFFGIVKDVLLLDYPWKTIPVAYTMLQKIEKLEPDIETRGLSFILLDLGMKEPALRPYVQNIFTLANKRRLLKKSFKIIQYLKKLGYTIYFATNKGYLSYLESLKSLPKSFGLLPDKVFTTYTDINSLFMRQLKDLLNDPFLHELYKKFLNDVLHVPEVENVYKVLHSKPNPRYYEAVLEHVQTIFVDDKRINIEGALLSGMNAGIEFKNPDQLFAELLKLKVLDVKRDFN